MRLLLTPGVRLRASREELAIGERTRSVLMMATPHFGTPLANFFTTVQGRHLLQLLTVLATSGAGRQSIFWGAQLLRLVARADDVLGRTETFLDQLSRRLLDGIRTDIREPLWEFLVDVSGDQGAVIQLTPEGMNLYNAAVVDRPDVHYGSVLTAAPPPGARDLARMVRPGRVLMSAIFVALYCLCTREHAHYPYPSPAGELEREVERQLPFSLRASSNDGIVPTLSQIYGTLVDVVVGDHLDVVGQFYQAGGQAGTDWLPSGAGFDEARFRSTWDRVAGFIAAA